MTGIFGRKPQAAAGPSYSGVDLQTSALGVAIPILFGQDRVSPNLGWYGDFRATKGKKQGGKGGITGGGKGGSSPTTYSASVILMIGEGVVPEIGRVWNAKAQTTLSQMQATLFTGTAAQAPWGYLQSRFPGDAYGYSDTAYIAAANMQLGETPTLGNFSFEAQSEISGSIPGSPDVDLADISTRLITDARRGLGLPLTVTATQWTDYCRALGLTGSLALKEQVDARQILEQLAKAGNARWRQSGASLQAIPQGDQAVNGNGHSWAPPSAPLFDLTYDDFISRPGQAPVEPVRKRSADRRNVIKIEWKDRAKEYNTAVTEAVDDASVAQIGRKEGQVVQAHVFKRAEPAQLAAQFALQAEARLGRWRFRLDHRYAHLESLDIVTITCPLLQLDRVWVRILEIDRDFSTGTLTLEVEEYGQGTGSAASYSYQTSDGFSDDWNAPAPNVAAPVIFEPAPGLTDGARQAWIAVTGLGDWGGCEIWVSDDGSTYRQADTVYGGARYGTLQTALPSASSPDTSNQPVVNLAVSAGELTSGTTADALALNTASLVGNEVIAFRDAALTAPSVYQLGYLVRGAAGTTVASHGIGTRFIRLDENIATYEFDETRVGKTIYLKFLSFNRYGGGRQSLADVSAYTYTLTGSSYRPPVARNVETPAAPTNPATAVPGQIYALPDGSWVRLAAGGGSWEALPTVGARAGLNLRNFSDTVTLGDGDIITSQGTAADTAAVGGTAAATVRDRAAQVAAAASGFADLTAAIADARAKALWLNVTGRPVNLADLDGGASSDLAAARSEIAAARRGLSDLLASVSAAALSATWSQVVNRPLTLAQLDSAAATDVINTRTELVAARGPAATVGARITAEETLRASEDAALAGRATTLEGAVFDGVTGLAATRARLTTEETTRANADSALAVRATNLETEVTGARQGQASVSARLSQIDVARSDGDAALAGRATTLEARAQAAESSNALNRNPLFADYPAPPNAVYTPPGWWGFGLGGGGDEIQRVAGVGGSPWALQTVSGGTGFALGVQSENLANRITAGWHVVECDFTHIAGSLDDAGVLVYYFVPAVGWQGRYLTFRTIGYDPAPTNFWQRIRDLDGEVITAGVGRRRRFRHLFRVDTTGGNAPISEAYLYGMAKWAYFAELNTTATSIRWERLLIRPATPQEVQAQQAALTDIPSLSARITTEEAVRAAADTALAGRATTLEAQIADTAGSGLRSRIATEEAVRAAADSAEASARTTLAAKLELSANLFPDPNGSRGTAWFDGIVGSAFSRWASPRHGDTWLWERVVPADATEWRVAAYDIPIGPGTYMVSAYGTMSANISVYAFYVVAYDAAWNVLAVVGANSFPQSADPFQRRTIVNPITCPAGTTTLRIVAEWNVAGARGQYAFTAMRQIQVEAGSVATVFNESGQNRAIAATVQQNSGAIATLNGATAWWQLLVNASGGLPAIFRLLSGQGGSEMLLAAARVVLANVDGTIVREALRLISGDVHVVNKLFVGASIELDPTAATISITAGSAKLVLGTGFGASSNLCLWFGPSMALSAMTTTNATLCLTTSGGGRFRDTLLVGDLSNARRTTELADDASIVIGPFTTNGAAKTVSVGYTARWDRDLPSNTAAASGFISASGPVERRLNGMGSWTSIGTWSASGSYTIVDDAEPGVPSTIDGTMSGSVTITDTAGTASDTIEYRARITSRTNIGHTPDAQELSILSVEAS